jgi:hypothetical protein
MTLCTSIAIGKPHNVREIFDFCNRLLAARDSVQFEQKDCEYRPGQRRIANAPMQGLSALLWIYYGIDGPMVHEHDEWCETEVGPAKWDKTGQAMVTKEDIDEHRASIDGDPTQNGWGAIEVTFDTAYGFKGEGGESCSDLHARLVTALGQWLDVRGLPWKWNNEFTGEWFDRYDGLAEFGDAYRATGAADWFQNLALPAIQAHIDRGGAS